MNILLDINHPGHVHLYRNLIFALINRSHKVMITVKNNISSAKELLNIYGLRYISLSDKSDNLIAKSINQIKYLAAISTIIKKENINMGIGTSINLAHASRITGMNSIILDDDDDDVEPLFSRFAHPFCDVLLSPDALKNKRKNKRTIYYSGFHELAYLHPKRFTPDPAVLRYAGLLKDEKYFILRFNSFKAHHDIGNHGLSLGDKRRLICKLKEHGKIFISSENDIEPEFNGYKVSIPPHMIHSFIYFSTLLLGDSQTMSSEAAVLATPSLRANSFVGRISYLEEEEHKYGLTFGFRPGQTEYMFSKIDELLTTPDLKKVWLERRDKMLNDKIDVTAFLVWFVENFPDSYKIMRQDPDYQFNFK